VQAVTANSALSLVPTALLQNQLIDFGGRPTDTGTTGAFLFSLSANNVKHRLRG